MRYFPACAVLISWAHPGILVLSQFTYPTLIHLWCALRLVILLSVRYPWMLCIHLSKQVTYLLELTANIPTSQGGLSLWVMGWSLSIYLSVYLSIYLSIYYLFFYLYIYLIWGLTSFWVLSIWSDNDQEMFDEVKPKRVNKNNWRDLSGGPVVKTSPSDAGGVGLIPHLELRFHMPRGQNFKA